MAFDRTDLIPDSWAQTGTIAATMANIWTDRGRYKPEDFIPRPRPVRILSAAAGLAWMRGISAAAAAKFKRETTPSPPSAGSRSDCSPTPPGSPLG
jgi:hypothetical protein